MKQLDLKLFWLYDNVEQKIISPIFTLTEQMPADILTKVLPKIKVELFSKMIGLTNTKNIDNKISV